MGELSGIEDLKFDWAGAAQLSAELRSTATVLDAQVPRRNSIAQAAKSEWRGVFSEQFLDRMKVCTTDAGRLADAMRQAATDLDELAQLARDEQARRDRAQAWEAENASEGILESGFEKLTGTDEEPFSEPPIEPKNVQIPSVASSGRG